MTINGQQSALHFPISAPTLTTRNTPSQQSSNYFEYNKQLWNCDTKQTMVSGRKQAITTTL